MSSAEAADVEAAGPSVSERPAVGGPVAAVTAADEGHPARWWILAVLAAVAFMAQLDRNAICAQTN